MQSDPCRAGTHASCVQPDPDCDCACHKGEGTKETWQEAVRINLDCEPGLIGPIYISAAMEHALLLAACYEERKRFAVLSPSSTKELHLGAVSCAENEDWVIAPEWAGDLHGATYPTTPPDTGYYSLQPPPIVDDKTGLLQGERAVTLTYDDFVLFADGKGCSIGKGAVDLWRMKRLGEHLAESHPRDTILVIERPTNRLVFWHHPYTDIL